MSDPTIVMRPASDTARFLRVAALVALTVGLNSIMGALTGEKTTFLFKEEMHLSASDIGTLALLLGIPAYLQPFMGAWTDMFPLFGYHRRSYWVAATLVAAVGNVGLAMLHQYHYAAVASLIMLRSAGGVLFIVMFNAVMVSVGNQTGSFGRLQSLAMFVPLILSFVYTAHLGGYVTEHWSYHRAFLTAALFDLVRIPFALLIEERRIAARTHDQETDAERAARQADREADRERTRRALKQAATSPGLWAMVGFVFYLIITPGLNTAQIYFERDVLHFSRQFIGDLGKWGALGAAVGIVVFGVGSRWMPVKSLVWGAWLMDCSLYPISMLLHDQTSGKIVVFGIAFLGTIYALCLNTLAARACPPGIEGTVYGLVMSAIALAGNLSEKFGSWLYDHFGPPGSTVAHGWNIALWVGLGFTLLAVVFIPFLPAWTRSSDPLRPTGTPRTERDDAGRPVSDDPVSPNGSEGSVL